MQAVAHLIEQYSTQLSPMRDPSTGPARLGSGFDTALEPVIEPWTPVGPRWSESPLCDSGDDVDEDEAYFLGEDDDEDDDDYDEDEDDDYDDDDDDNDELDKDDDMDEDDF